MRITSCIGTLLAAVFLAAQPTLVSAQTPTRKPNIVFIMADDLGVQDLGCYGRKDHKTPNLDKLAARSVQFNRAYCQQAVCNPSRSSLLTGRRPDTLRLWNNGTHFRELNPDVTTLPLWFQEHGYTTRCVGKIFHNWHTAVKGDRRSWSADEFLHYANHGADTPQMTGELPPNLATLSHGRGYAEQGITTCRDVLLLEPGADPFAKTNAGRDPTSMARKAMANEAARVISLWILKGCQAGKPC